MKDIVSRIATKVGPVKKEIDDRVAKDFRELEIQLFEEDIATSKHFAESVNNCKRDDINVHFVHSPLRSKSRYQLIEMFNPRDKICLNIIRFAHELAKFFKHEVCVVFHTELPAYMIEQDSVIIKSIEDIFDDLLWYYDDVTYTFENVTPTNDYDGGFVAGSLYENVLLCEHLRDSIDSHYFYTTLDLCHVITTKRIVRSFINSGYEYRSHIDYWNFFAQNAPYCNNIHFNYVEEFGFKQNQHGVIFDKNSCYFESSLEYIKNYMKDDTQITLEVLEQDYSNIQNAVIQRDNIIRYVSELEKKELIQ